MKERLQELMRELKQLHLGIEKDGRKFLKEWDLSLTQGLILNTLFQHQKEGIYASKLHEDLGISRSFVSSNLKILRQKGFLDVLSDPKDERRKFLVLTKQAKAQQHAIQNALDKLNQHLMSDDRLQDILNQIKKEMEESE